MAKFLVTVTKVTIVVYEQTEVEADTMAEAQTTAQAMAENDDLDEDKVDDAFSSTAQAVEG